MVFDVPSELLPHAGERCPVLALTADGLLLGYFESVDAAMAASESMPVVLYVAR